MKTRTLIIIGIVVIGTIPFVTFTALERYENYLEQLEYEAQRIANEPKLGEKYYIEPKLKAKLEGVELDLREKVRQLHQGLPPSSYAINLDHQTKEIVVIVENKDLVSKIEEMITQYPEDISILIINEKITLKDFLRDKVEPNTIIIYDVTENGKTRLTIAPHTLVMNLTDGNIIRFVNDGSTSVNIFDRATGIWRFDDVKPSSQRVLTINSTGFYEILVQNSREGESGRIVVLDNDVNSLSVNDRIKMGKAIISDNFRKYPELVSVGVGNGEIGVHVTINKKELELHEDAKSYYHEKFSKIIPFEVPIIIEFGEPIRPD